MAGGLGNIALLCLSRDLEGGFAVLAGQITRGLGDNRNVAQEQGLDRSRSNEERIKEGSIHFDLFFRLGLEPMRRTRIIFGERNTKQLALGRLIFYFWMSG